MSTDELDPPREPRFWVNTVSLDHVELAAAGGFTQADHGARTRLGRPRPGDRMVFYSPRTELGGGHPVRRFTALATITGEAPYPVTVTDDFRPWRLAATFQPSRSADARALIGRLSFVTDEAHWGLPFRRGLFTIPTADFAVIEEAMTV